MSNNSIDFDTLNELKEIMEDEFNVLVSIFISDGKNQIDNLRLSIDSSNTEDVKRIAHTLKGTSSNLGVSHLSELCKTLEHNAADNKLEDANELWQKILSEYEEVKATLEKLS